MRIKSLVGLLRGKHKTSDPFEIASKMGIVITQEQLGAIRGYYNKCFRQQFIHINENMDDKQKRITCAHELGHCILHPNANTPFLREQTLFSVDKLEVQANKFMAQLLISDDSILGMINEEYTIGQISRIYGIPEYLVQYKTDTLSVYDARK